jgi:hypothetical protein
MSVILKSSLVNLEREPQAQFSIEHEHGPPRSDIKNNVSRTETANIPGAMLDRYVTGRTHCSKKNCGAARQAGGHNRIQFVA